MWKGLIHCGQCRPWAGSLGFYIRKQVEQAMEEANRKCSLVVSALSYCLAASMVDWEVRDGVSCWPSFSATLLGSVVYYQPPTLRRRERRLERKGT